MIFDEVDRLRMRRCFHLASLGSYHVKTNPQVGALIVAEGTIIGEGYHQKYGGPHAEIEALRSVSRTNRSRIKGAHMYVSLEPCYHEGKTPPCVDAILKAGIDSVTISVKDPNPETAGKSMAKLKEHGIEVRFGLLEAEGKEMITPFFVHQKLNLPYIILKWAQSKDRFIGRADEQIWLSNEQSKLAVHKWRQEIDAIMIGTNTAVIDNPKLTNRRGHGKSPVRILLDRYERVPKTHHILSDDHETVVFTTLKNYVAHGKYVSIYHITEEEWSIEVILKKVYALGHAQCMIEGGKTILNHCIKEQLWHEARVIQTNKCVSKGIKSPNISGRIMAKLNLAGDKVFIINNLNNRTFLI